MRRFNSILILSSALIMASCAEKSNQQVAAVVVEEAPKVTVTQVYAENVPQLSTYPTTVEAEVVNNITPQSASRINKILVEVGDHVKKDQKLATMDAINLEKLRLQIKNDSIEYELNDVTIRTLAPSDFLIHLCCHLFKEATTYDGL